MQSAINNWHSWLWPTGTLTLAALVAFIGQSVLFNLLSRWNRQKGGPLISSLIRHGRKPAAWILPFLALLVALPAARFPASVLPLLQRGVGLCLIAATGWLAIVASATAFETISARYRLDTEDNLAARRVQTQVLVLHRIVVVLVVIVTVSVMLM